MRKGVNVAYCLCSIGSNLTFYSPCVLLPYMAGHFSDIVRSEPRLSIYLLLAPRLTDTHRLSKSANSTFKRLAATSDTIT